MDTRRIIIAVVILSALCLAGLVTLGVWGVSVVISRSRQAATARYTSPAATHAYNLPEPGSYQVGIHGTDRDGNATALRSLMPAIYAPAGQAESARGLAEALALEAGHLVHSLSVLPAMPSLQKMEVFVPDREPDWGHLSFTREQGLQVARQAAFDAVLAVEVTQSGGGMGASLALIDMADESVAFTKELSGKTPEEIVEAFPGTLKEALEAAGVSLSERDKELLGGPPFPAADYVRNGTVVALWPSKRSIEECRSFLDERPDSPLAQWLEYWQWQCDWPAERVRKWAEEWVKASKEACPCTLLGGVEAQIGAGNYAGAETLLAEYEQVKPGSFRATKLRRDSYESQKQYAAAVAEARKLVEMNPLSGRTWYLLGSSYWLEAVRARGGHALNRLSPQDLQTFMYDVRVARACLEQALKLAPDNPDVLTSLVQARNETDGPAATEQALDMCDAVRPGYHYAYDAMLWVYRPGYGNDPAAYQDLLRRADRQKPKWVWDEIQLAKIVRELSPDAAERHYQRAAEMAPDYFPWGWWQMADGMVELEYQGDDAREREAAALKRAEEYVERSIEQLPSIRARTTRAKVLCRRRQYEEAESELKALVKEEPAAADTLILLGGTQRALGKWGDAEKTLRAAIKAMKPRSAHDEWLAVLQCIALDGRQDEALAELEKNRRTHRDWYAAVGSFHLGSSYLAMLEVDKAEEVYNGIPEAEGGYAVMDNIGLCKMHRGDWSGALAQFEKAYARDGKGEVEPPLGIAVCKYKLGAKEEAFPLYDEAERIDHRWLCPEGLREQLWPPEGIAAFEELQAAREKAG
jgi:tetratricopeptide (TPR) repeat protein